MFVGKAKVPLRANECPERLETHWKYCLVCLPLTTADVSLDFRSKFWIKKK